MKKRNIFVPSRGKERRGKIPALTFDAKADGWERSTGFVKRMVPMPRLDERRDPKDALAVILKNSYAGVCGTDRGIWYRKVFRDLIAASLKREEKTTRILGHEFVGKVVAAGSQVQDLFGIKVGDNVSGDSHVTCGRCFQCRVGEEEVCQDQSILGISRDGVFAPYVKVPAKNLWQVDFTRIRPEIAAILDPFGNAIHACSKVDLKGKRVAIVGCGPIGLFAVLLSRAFGAAKILAVDVEQKNILMAKKLGAHFTLKLKKTVSFPEKLEFRNNGVFPGADPELLLLVRRLTYGKGMDVSFEMAGPNSSVINAIESTRSGGHVILFGLKDGDFTIPHFRDLIVRGLTLHGVIGRQIFQTWQTSQRVLSDKSNGVQDKIWDIILNRGRGTILPFTSYTKELFEKKMTEYPKILIRM